MKLTIEHLAPYLPYGLKMHNDKGGRGAYIKSLGRRAKQTEDLTPELMEVWIFLGRKPILRPLSDLTKEVEEGFIPANDMMGFEGIVSDYGSKFNLLNQVDRFTNIVNGKGVSLNDYQILIKHHFDVFGLIDAGFAIDINTVN